jgi:type IV pilus assembly protein PilY1
MKQNPRTLAQLILSTVVPTVLMSSFHVGDANAAPGLLQNVPFAAISTSVQPNILFLLDDSGSMQWEYVRRDGQDQGGWVDLTPTSADNYRDLCLGYNTLAYNPAVTYLPWKGKDVDGADFTNQSSTRALITPYNATDDQWATTGSFGYNFIGWVNLEDPSNDGVQPFGYTQWIDTNAVTGVPDGVYQGDDTGNVATNECKEDNFIAITSLDADQKENLANWYSYYRSRESVAKNSMLSVIDVSRSRVGVAGLINNPGADGITIKDIDDISLSDGTTEGDTRRTAAINNKTALMNQVASSASSGGTPLSASLLEAGEYFREGGDVPAEFFGTAVAYNAAGTSSTEQTISSTSPILNADNGGTCQANFTVLFTDGFAFNNTNTIGDAVGNADGGTSDSDFDGGTFADGFDGTLADVAMHYLERDLAPSLTDNTNITDIRREGEVLNHQHMTTYTIGFGVNGTLDANPSPTDTAFVWPLPVNGLATSIDDMRHAAWNGRGKFLASSDPQQLVTDINNVFLDINARTQSTTAASSVSSGFIQESSLVFQTQFDAIDWSGNLFTYRYDENGIVDIANPIFDVQSVLSTQVLVDNEFAGAENMAGYTNSRNIITKKIDLNDIATNSTTATTLKTGPGVIFDYGELSASQQLIFAGSRTSFPDWVGTDDALFGAALVNFITGDSTHENDDNGEVAGQRVFRDRQQRYLGAVVNSSSQFVGVPSERYTDEMEGTLASERYSSFKTAQSARTPMVYVGANDGMLHAFDASVNTTTTTDINGDTTTAINASSDSGSEVFAYVPAILTADLPQLAQPAYGFDSFVDATPTLRDVFVDADGAGAGTDDAWRTYLVGGLRNGGRGIYALDVTDPATTFGSSATTNAKAAEIVRFEYTHEDLGYTFSRPQIAKMNDGSWVTIVANGYNAVGDGAAKLFLIDLDTGLPLTGAGPTVGGNASNGILNTGAGTNLGGSCLDIDATDGDPASDCNGLSSPALVDLNGDLKVDRIYAGDLHGHMWVFNVQSADKTQWSVTKLFTATQSSCTAVGNGSNCRQPITTVPEVTLHPSKRSLGTAPNVLVLFGTGQFIAEGDASITDNQSFYNVWDTTGTSGIPTNDALTKSDLVARTFGGNEDNITITGTTAGYNTAASPSALRNFGWYIDLAGSIAASSTDSTTSDPFDRGRVSIDPIISGSVILFITTVPSGGVVCNKGEIPGFLTALDIVSGQTPDFAVFTDDNGDPVASSTIALTSGAVGFGIDTTKDGTQTRVTNIDGTLTQEKVSTAKGIPSGRKSWSILR